MPHLELPAVILHHLAHVPHVGRIRERKADDLSTGTSTTAVRRQRQDSFHFAGLYVHRARPPKAATRRLSQLLHRHHEHAGDSPAPTLAAPPSDSHAFRAYVVRDPWLLLHKAVYFLLQGGFVCFIPFLVSLEALRSPRAEAEIDLLRYCSLSSSHPPDFLLPPLAPFWPCVPCASCLQLPFSEPSQMQAFADRYLLLP